jgi:hypothetical protein
MQSDLMMLETIGRSWGWTGLRPLSVRADNDFGNLIVEPTEHDYWRICPEALSCERIAGSSDELETLWTDENFQHDWRMMRLVAIAASNLGAATAVRCYCLKLPAVLGGGQYDVSNLGMISRIELIGAPGNLARQTKDLPNGQRVRIKIIGPPAE